MPEQHTVRHPPSASARENEGVPRYGRIPGVLSRPPGKRFERESQLMWRGFGDAWTALSTIIAGIAVWGAVGFGLDKLFGTDPVLFVIGVLVGNFAAIYLIYVKALNESKEAPKFAPWKKKEGTP